MSEPAYWSVPASKERPNEDALFVSEEVAVVVDGAGLPRSMRAGCHHSVAWYSHELARTFGTALGDLGLTMPQALSRAITEVSQRHGDCDLANGSPSATVAAWRLRPPEVEYLVLCDASVVVATVDDVVEVTDDRLSALMAERLDQFAGAAEGGTLSAAAILEARGAILESGRNVEGGFWCCQIDPTAADYALVGSRLLSDILGIVIATDGATRGFQSLGVHTMDEFAERTLSGEGAVLLEDIRAVERGQRQQLLTNAIKVHDDATLVALDLRQPEQHSLQLTH